MPDADLTPEQITEGLRLDAARTPGPYGCPDGYCRKPDCRGYHLEGPPGVGGTGILIRLRDGEKQIGDFLYLLHAANHHAAALRQLQRLDEQYARDQSAYALMQKGMESQAELMDGLKQQTRRQAEEIARLKGAIVEHHGQKADDRCWLDDHALYRAAGLEPADNAVGDMEAMLANCKRFLAKRCQGGGPWKTYRELEEEIARLRAALAPFARLRPNEIPALSHLERAAQALAPPPKKEAPHGQ